MLSLKYMDILKYLPIIYFKICFLNWEMRIISVIVPVPSLSVCILSVNQAEKLKQPITSMCTMSPLELFNFQ